MSQRGAKILSIVNLNLVVFLFQPSFEENIKTRSRIISRDSSSKGRGVAAIFDSQTESQKG